MPRPKTPLLSRKKIVGQALQIIDDEGVDKLNIHRLARALAVKGPSIYYYFKDRDELLAAVCLTVLDDVRIPRRRSREWADWLTQDAVAYFRALSAHPNLAGLMLERKSRPGAAQRFEAALEQMKEAGIEPADGLAIIDCIEGIALTWIAFRGAPAIDQGFGNLDKLAFPTLDEASRKQRYDEASYKRVIAALLRGMDAAAGAGARGTQAA